MIMDANTAILFFGGGGRGEEVGNFEWISNKQPLRYWCSAFPTELS